MDQRIAQAVAAARAGGAGLATWQAIAEQAREPEDDNGLAFALRHVAELALKTAGGVQAEGAAGEAVELYRRLGPGHRLDLANALRLRALAREAGGGDGRVDWEEAKAGYRACGVAGGVAECEAHLAD